MKTSELKKFMALAIKLNVKNPTLPACGYLRYKDGVLSANDLETQIQMKADFGEKPFCIEFNMLNGLLKSIDAKTTIIIKDTGVFVNGNLVMQYIQYFDMDDMPKIRTADPAQQHFRFYIQPDLISKVVKFSGKDELRPVMSGVHYDQKNYVATDANIMAFEKATPTTFPDFPGVIFSKIMIALLPKCGSLMVDYYDVVSGETYKDPFFQFLNEDITVTVLAIDGKYPNYEAVIPQQNPLQYSVNKKAFKSAITLAITAANKTSYFGILHFAENEVTIVAENLDNDTKCTIPVKDGYRRTVKPVDGKIEELPQDHVFVIGYNLKYLLAAVDYIDDVSIKLAVSQPNRATIINEKVLVMPAQIK